MEVLMEQHQRLTEQQTGMESSPSLEIEAENRQLRMEHAKGIVNRLWAVPEHTVVLILQMVLLVILCIVGTLTNTLVFWIFNRRPALRSLSNRFVLSLVTSNILISTIISPLLLFDSILAQYLLLPYINPIISTISNSVLFSAIFSTFLIATDRFYAVTSPLHYSMTITRSRSQIMIVVAWICATILALPTIVLYSAPPSSEDFQQSLLNISSIIQILLGYLLPFISLCWLYLRMYHAAHKNSERTRKHSISGELLTVMDGSTSVIPQGIDFLTHYMNPFSKTPMSGSVQTATTGHGPANGVLVTVKKPRRRSSSGSSSSLLFREEGRAIKTAFLVLASFLLCWSPHFIDIMQTLFRSLRNYPRPQQLPYGGWSRFLSVTGMLLSSVLNPFIYVFRNKMACKEVTKLLCGFIREHRRKSMKKPRHNKRRNQVDKNGVTENETCKTLPQGQLSMSTNGSCVEYNMGSPYSSTPIHHPPATPLPKSPRRSSMKSLTPQSSLNSNSTQVNFTTNDSSSSSDSPVLFLNKPPFLRSLTLPERETVQHVKFPPILIRQKSYVQQTVSNPLVTDQQLHQHNHNRYHPLPLSQDRERQQNGGARRPKFTRQDSICSIVSNDSVLMFCTEDHHRFSGPECVCAAATSTAFHRPLSISSRPLLGLGHGLSHGHGHGNEICARAGVSMEMASSQNHQIQNHYHHLTKSCSQGSGSGSTSPPPPSGNSGTPSHSNSNESSGSFCTQSRSYLRQDSNFSDVSHKTTDSGVVSDMIIGHGRSSAGFKEAETTFTTFTSPDHLNLVRHQNANPNSTQIQDVRHQGTNTRLIFCTGACVHDLPLLQTTI